MGCGKQSGRESAGILIVPNILGSSYLGIPKFAEMIEDFYEPSPPQQVKQIDESKGPLSHTNDSLANISNISGRQEEVLKRYTLKYRSPTEVIKKIEENNLRGEVDFDFLNESSKIVKKGKRFEESLDVEILS